MNNQKLFSCRVFDTNACMGTTREENIDAMFKALEQYGKY